MRNLSLAFAIVASVIATSGLAAKLNCNTRTGQISDQPASPERIMTPEEIAQLPDPDEGRIAPQAYDKQTLKIRLETDIDDLHTLGGRFTDGVVALLVRLENNPNFDITKHCNLVIVQVWKPRIDVVGPKLRRASYDAGSIAIDIDNRTPLDAFRVGDPSGHYVWIFPGYFGRYRNTMLAWEITKQYDDAFKAAPKGSDRRRWIAEAYINLVLRRYRLEEMSRGFPEHHVKRNDLDAILKGKAGIECDRASKEVTCLVNDLIELNEVGISHSPYFPSWAFLSGDAIYQNSGISTGIRQLDFSTNNEQASKLAPDLLPALFRDSKPGYGWRRPIRLWDVNTLTSWYGEVGKAANARLSQPDAQSLLLSSHVDFIAESGKMLAVVQKMYPSWPLEEQLLVSIVSVDLENVSGHRLYLPKSPSYYCSVLLDDTTADTYSRTNKRVVLDHEKRVGNAFRLIGERFPHSNLDTCRGAPH